MFLSDPTTLKVTMGTSPTASCRFLRAPHPHTALWPAHVKLLLLESYITVLVNHGPQERARERAETALGKVAHVHVSRFSFTREGTPA